MTERHAPWRAACAATALSHGARGRTPRRAEVRDEGRTIAEGVRDQIFSAFERLPQPSNPTAGYGLGLALCKLAVESHGGRIGVTPVDDEGNCFWFELPPSRSGAGSVR